LVWLKSRTDPEYGGHAFYDTVRGNNQLISPSGDGIVSATAGNQTTTPSLNFTSFNNNGFTLGGPNNYFFTNNTSQNYVSWTFRKQPKFFDVVTYTGTGSARTVAHNLGSVPGCIIVKSTSNTSNWAVYHRSLTDSSYYLVLNSTSQEASNTAFWNNTAPTATEFSLGTIGTTNGNGLTYVAYLFAHNAGGFGLTGTDNVISCGSVSGFGTVVDLGFEPQWILMKQSNGTSDWIIADNMRGIATGGNDALLFANTSGAETSANDWIDLTSTGFVNNVGSGTFIYIAIRRGPMKVPTTGTSVFAPVVTSSLGTIVSTNFPVDLSMLAVRPSETAARSFMDRLRGGTTTTYFRIRSNGTNAEDTGTGNGLGFDNNNGVINNWSSDSAIFWNFRRAPGFFDEVCYTGTGANRTVAHNLAAVPELMIVKGRSNALNWRTYNFFNGSSHSMNLNDDGRSSNIGNVFWNSTTPTASVFSIGTDDSVNASGQTFVAYLFASAPGVSKVGNYTGNGSSQTINCGFTGGARFVMVKRTNVEGNWLVVDTARGLVSAGDPTLYLNSTAAEVTGNDWIDPDSSGFIVNQTSTINANVNGASYIFLAIA
jgi:hypothetical protein